MLSAIAFNLGQFKILLFGKELNYTCSSRVKIGQAPGVTSVTLLQNDEEISK